MRAPGIGRRDDRLKTGAAGTGQKAPRYIRRRDGCAARRQSRSNHQRNFQPLNKPPKHATAKAAQADGARVIVIGRARDRLQAAQSELGSGARSVALDIADEGGTRALFQELDRVDHIFITAGSLALDARLTPDSASLRPAMDIRFWARLMPPSTAPPK